MPSTNPPAAQAPHAAAAAAATAAAAAAVAAFAVQPLVNQWFVPLPATNTIIINDDWRLTNLNSLNPLVSKGMQSFSTSMKQQQ